MCSLCSNATSKMHQMSSYAHCEEFMKKLPQRFDHSQAFIMKVTGIERHLYKCENKQHNEVKNDEIEHSIGTVQLLSLAGTAAFNNSLWLPGKPHSLWGTNFCWLTFILISMKSSSQNSICEKLWTLNSVCSWNGHMIWSQFVFKPLYLRKGSLYLVWLHKWFSMYSGSMLETELCNQKNIFSTSRTTKRK